jgi:hypothetical protein
MAGVSKSQRHGNRQKGPGSRVYIERRIKRNKETLHLLMDALETGFRYTWSTLISLNPEKLGTSQVSGTGVSFSLESEGS